MLRLAALVLMFIATSWIVQLCHRREAQARGARMIPRVRGRLPLNLDVVAGWRAGTYVGSGMILKLVGQYGKTLNTRAMGEDSVRRQRDRMLLNALNILEQFITVDASQIQAILADPETFEKGDKYRERVQGMLGRGIFAADGEQWRQRRKLLKPYFSCMYGLDEAINKHAQVLIDGMQGTFDFQRLAGSFALGVASDVLFGSEVAMPDEVIEAFNEAQRVVADRIKIGTLWALAEATGDRLTAPMSTIRAWTQSLSARPGTLLEYLKEDELATEELVNILLAARDTTASALTSCAYCMALHPEASRGRDFVLEVLRLYPPVPLKWVTSRARNCILTPG